MCAIMPDSLIIFDEWTENIIKGSFNPTDRTTEVSRYEKMSGIIVAAKVNDCESGRKSLNKRTILTLGQSNGNNFNIYILKIKTYLLKNLERCYVKKYGNGLVGTKKTSRKKR